LRFFARWPRRDHGDWCARSPYTAADVGPGHASRDSCSRDVPLPVSDVAWPGREMSALPAALMGFIPSQCCSCPPGLEASSFRLFLTHLPFRDRLAPIIFVGGSAVRCINLDSVTHFGVERQPIADVRRGSWASIPADNPCRARDLLWNHDLCAAVTALGFASLRSVGALACAARSGSTPFRAISLRKSASGSYPLVGFSVVVWKDASRRHAVTQSFGHNRCPSAY
jgi:hypothetical protein